MTSETAVEPKFRRLEPDERRSSILRAASELFAAKPYNAVAAADIAERAGVVRSLLNHYFGTKRNLFLQVVRESATVPQIAVDSLPASDLEGRISAAVDWFLDAAERNPQSWLLGSVTNDPDLDAILSRAESESVERVLQAVQLDDFIEGASEIRAALRAYGQLARCAAREWLHRSTLTREQAHTLMSQTLRVIVADVHPAFASTHSG